MRRATILALLLLGAGLARAEGPYEDVLPESRAPEKLARLDAELSRGEWAAGVALAHELVANHRDDLVAGQAWVSSGTTSEVVPVWLAVRALLGRHARAGGPRAPEELLAEDAARALERATSSAALLDVGDRFFPLEVGARALLRAGDRALERGEPIAASAAWRSVAEHHPSPGQREAARARLGLLELFPSTSNDRAVHGSGAVAPVGSIAWPLAKQPLVFVVGRSPASGLGLQGESAVIGSHLVWHLGSSIDSYPARRLEGLGPPPREWTYGAGDLVSGFTAPSGVAALGSHLYATVLHRPEHAGRGEWLNRGDVVALDLETGHVAWEVPASGERSFHGTPLPLEDRVFCGARSSEAEVVALDAHTGAVLWSRALATVTAPRRSSVRPARLGTPVLAACSGALVACSENGVLAALDPATGRVLWAHAYEHEAHPPIRRPAPPLEVGGAIVVMPADGARCFAVSRATGERLDSFARGSFDHVVGSVHGHVVLAGDTEVALVELPRSDPADPTPVVWTAGLGNAALRGRALLARDRVLVPTVAGIACVRFEGEELTLIEGWSRVARDVIPGPDGGVLVVNHEGALGLVPAPR